MSIKQNKTCAIISCFVNWGKLNTHQQLFNKYAKRIGKQFPITQQPITFCYSTQKSCSKIWGKIVHTHAPKCSFTEKKLANKLWRWVEDWRYIYQHEIFNNRSSFRDHIGHHCSLSLEAAEKNLPRSRNPFSLSASRVNSSHRQLLSLYSMSFLDLKNFLR